MIIYVAVLGIVSLVTFSMCGADKSKAKRGAWRISERVLLGFSFLGGAVGGLCGMLIFRHKTKHWYFWLVNFAGLLWQIGLIVALILLEVPLLP